MIIYKITNNVNDKVYIGQTIQDLKIRQCQHISCSKRGISKSYITQAIRKHGIEQFTWEVLDICKSLEELDEKETHYIDMYNTTNIEKGYNIQSGGRQTPIYYGESHPMYGRKHTEESKKLMSEHLQGVNKGIVRSPETRAKMSLNAHTGGDWQVTTPEGEVSIIRNLMRWCEERNISRNAIKRPNGTKGYKAVRLD